MFIYQDIKYDSLMLRFFLDRNCVHPFVSGMQLLDDHQRQP